MPLNRWCALQPYITKTNTTMRSYAKKGGSDVVPPKAKLAMTLQWLATGCSQIMLENTWGWARSTISGLLKDTVGAMGDHLIQPNISFPKGSELTRVMNAFAAAGLPGCVGAIDGCLLPIKNPHPAYGHLYYCYKHYHAVLLLAVCDSEGIILNIDAGHPGMISTPML